MTTLPVGAVTDPAVLEAYRHDQAAWCPGGVPRLLVRPTSEAEVVDALRWASDQDVVTVPRGAGSGLSGGAAALDDCLVLSAERLARIVDIDVVDQLAVVEAGVLNGTLKQAAAAEGLWYPPDPASADFSTLGGNVATNAGGLCCVKYGTTRQWVLGARAVTAAGEVLQVGGRTLKSAAGLDLLGLLTGSEGTLAVLTELTLRLAPERPERATLVAQFADLESAGRAVTRITAKRTPYLLELMDGATIASVEAYQPMGLDTGSAALLFAQSDADDAGARLGDVEGMRAVCLEGGAEEVHLTSDQAEGEMLLAARRLAYPSLERQGMTLLDDVAVPRSRLPELLAACISIGATNGVLVASFGHAGDGNMHPTVVVPHDDVDARVRAQQAFAQIVRTALDLGGTVTGEHGVGSLKLTGLRQQLDPVNARLQREVKRAFDPKGLLNPGRALA